MSASQPREGGWTAREREVLDLIAAGRTNIEIAAELGISFSTAKWHVSELISKAGVDSREEVAAYWLHERRWTVRSGRAARALVSLTAVKVAAATAVVAIGAGIAALALRVGDGGGGLDSARESPPPATVGATLTGTASAQAGPSVAATPTEAPRNPVYGYDQGTTTGVPEVDAVMAEISAADLDALTARVVAQLVPCATAGTPASSAQRCPPGVEGGSLVPIVTAEFCSGGVAFPTSEVGAIVRPLLDGRPRLWGLLELPPGHPSSKSPGAPASRYVLFVVNSTDPPSGFTVILGADGGIHNLGYGCGDRPEQVWASWSTTGTALLSPPPAPRPR